MKKVKLSPSDLTFLWDECQRCFYLKVVHKDARPRAPFPRIFTLIDRLMNAHFQNKPSETISSTLPPGRVILGEQWVTSQPIPYADGEIQAVIRGRFDTALAFDDGTYGIVDFKTTQPSPQHVPFYSRQLHAYAYAVEHPTSRGLRMSPVTRLGLLCVEPNAMERDESGRIAYLGQAVWLEIPKDEAQFLGFIGQVLEVIRREEPPQAHPECEYCRYRQHARSSQW